MRHALTFTMALMLTASMVHAEEPEFVDLFNGEDLTGWFGDSRFWRVEDGAIIGETTSENPAEHNTFLIRRDEEYGDFELRFLYQVTGYNSGVQYRSEELDDFVVRGYQADFEDRWHEDGTVDKFSGMFFEERGRMFLAHRGSAVMVHPSRNDKEKAHLEAVGVLANTKELEQVIHRQGWNRYTVIAKGFQFTHLINGRVMAMGWDQDKEHRRASGLFAFQLHSGPPMQIKLKDIQVRRLE